MTQYVGGFPLPSSKSACGRKIVQLVRAVLDAGHAEANVKQKIDRLVWQVFGIEKDAPDFATA